jgi:hypothetical protein
MGFLKCQTKYSREIYTSLEKIQSKFKIESHLNWNLKEILGAVSGKRLSFKGEVSEEN